MSHNPHDIPERVFMNTLLKHTAIALAIIIPLAAYTAFARADTLGTGVTAQQAYPKNVLNEGQANEPSLIIIRQ